MSILRARSLLAAMVVLATASGPSRLDGGEKLSPSTLSMTPAVACRKIDGFEQFEPLEPAEITSDEKLQVYYRPMGYAIEKKGDKYLARFAQDGVVRRKGEKKAVWKKDKLLEYEAKSDRPPYQVYLTNSVGLKGLPPGEYELDITLRDALREGSSARQTLSFRIVPAPAAPPPD